MVVILVDTLRADHLGCYGYGRETSPNIDRLAREGVLFERAYTSSTFTGEAVGALFSGVWPMENPQGSGWYARPDPGRDAWPAFFRRAGYATGHFANSPIMNTPGFNEGFDQFSCLVQTFGVSGAGPQLTKRALEFMEQQRERPFSLYLHYMDPHAPYDPPEEYYRRFSDKAMDDPAHHVDDFMGNLAALRREGFGPGDPRFENLMTKYDAEIAFTDESIGDLMAGMEKLGLTGNTIVVLLADHGEEFLEHGYMDHAWNLFEETLRVPLLFWWPGQLTPGRVEEAASTVAVLPTLLALIGATPEGRDFSLPPLFDRGDAGWQAAAHTGPLFAEMQIETRAMLRAVMHEGYKYLSAARWLDEACMQALYLVQKPLRNSLLAGEWKPLHPRSPARREALYHLPSDPGELRDVATEQPEVTARLRGMLEAALAAAPEPKGPFEFEAQDPLPGLLETLRANPAAMDSAAVSDEQQAELEALGYMGGSAAGQPDAPCVLP